MELLIAGLILIALYAVPVILGYISYRRTNYFKITHKPYFGRDVGSIGEYNLYRKLRFLEKQNGRFLFNLYIPKANGETTEIDIVLLHPKGIFVFESKNYKGWIFGNSNNRYWTQVLPKGKAKKSNKERIYNPIRQNASHIKHLSKLLDLAIPMQSIVVFSNEATFKELTIETPTCEVVYLAQVRKIIKRHLKQAKTDALTSKQIDEIYDQLYPYSQVDQGVIERHNSREY